MEISDVTDNCRIKVAVAKGYAVFANTEEGSKAMKKENIQVAGDLDDLHDLIDLVVDDPLKKFGAPCYTYNTREVCKG